MAITKLSDSSITTGDKYISMLAGNAAFIPNSYESIATVTVGSGGSATIEFTSIPATYTHLQLRGIVKCTTDDDDLGLRFNSDSGTNYGGHRIYGSGASATADSILTRSQWDYAGRTGSGTSNFGVSVIDILDYTNTNKYKTTRALFGRDSNGSGWAMFSSGLWRSTSAITSITFVPSGGNFAQYTQFALYGIKGS
jgi:hypothetical protein